MKYYVPIGQDNFIIEVESQEQAIELAKSRFNDGDSPDELGNEWQEIVRVGTVEAEPRASKSFFALPPAVTLSRR